MVGFELQNSGAGSNLSDNCATTNFKRVASLSSRLGESLGKAARKQGHATKSCSRAEQAGRWEQRRQRSIKELIRLGMTG